MAKSALGPTGTSVADNLQNRVNCLYKQGQFGRDLFDGVDELRKRCRRDLRQTTSLKSLSLITEVLDYRGDLEAARDIVEGGGALLDEIAVPLSPSARLDALGLRREQIRFLANYARMSFYRNHSYKHAKELLTHCVDAARRLRRPDTFPCFGTMAQLNYYLGCAHRQLREYEQAEACYGEAIDCYRRKALLAAGKVASSREHKEHDERVRNEQFFARYRSALCLGLGFGWVNYTKGQLSRALGENVGPAEVLLLGTNDVIHRAYLSLLRGSILRCQAGADRPTLLSAIQEVERAQSMFDVGLYKRKAYAARAAWERALCALGLEDFDTADAEATKTETLARELNDRGWQCNAWIVRSRVRRRRGEIGDAETLAASAVATSQELEDPLILIDALMEQGEVLFERGHFDGSREKFLRALNEYLTTHPATRGSGNPKLEATLNIQIARTVHCRPQPSRSPGVHA